MRLWSLHPRYLDRAGIVALWREHLLKKLFVRDPDAHQSLRETAAPEPHPIFKPIAGDVEAWEKFPAEGKGRTNRTAKGRF